MTTLNVYWYGRGVEAFKTGVIDWVVDDIKVALTTAGYVPNQGTHQFFSDITNETAGTGYTAGGQLLTTKALTYDGTGRRVVLDAANVTWDPSSISARYAIIYKDTGTASTSPLIGYGDAATEQTTDAAPFSIEWHVDGILRTTATAPA